MADDKKTAKGTGDPDYKPSQRPTFGKEHPGHPDHPKPKEGPKMKPQPTSEANK